MMIGFFEGIDSERGIAWRLADSLTLRQFLAIGLDEQTPDHVTISRTLACHKAGEGFALRVQTQAAPALPVGGNPVIRHKLPARIAPGVQIPTVSRRCCSGR
jgi:hypothetical protein